MFRKPMRIEKWIAFDGAGVADLAEADDPDADGWRDDFHSDDGADRDGDHADPDTANENGTDMEFSPFSFVQALAQSTNTLSLHFNDYPEFDGMVRLTFPIGLDRPGHVDPDQSMYLPFLDDSLISLDIDPSAGIQLKNLFVGVSFPNNGSFTIYSTSLGISFSQFVIQNNIPVGTVIAYSPDGIHTSGDSTATIRIGTVTPHSGGAPGFGLANTMHVARGLIRNGSLRLGFLDEATTDHVNIILNSLVYRAGGAGAGGDSFSVAVYHDETGTPYSPQKLSEGGGSAFVPGNSSGAIQDASKPCDNTGAVIGGGNTPGGENPPVDPDPDPEPPVDPIPEPDPEPVDPTVPPPHVPPPENSGGEQDGRDADDSPLEAENDVAADAGDERGVWSLFVAEKEYEEEATGKDDAEIETESVVTLEAKDEAAEDDASGNLLLHDDIIREMRLALAEARVVHRALAEAVNRLYAEYAHRQGEAWDPGARERLAEMLAAGNAQRRQLARITELLTREMNTFRLTPPARRDGMMVEATRELADAAARHTGNADVLVQSLNGAADLLHRTRMAGEESPGDRELADAFARSHHEAALGWENLAVRRDPMGKELEFHTRLRDSADL